jgi:hypothetical protein
MVYAYDPMWLVIRLKLQRKLWFEKIEHPPYSSDLAPINYYLFPNLKKELRGTKFWSAEEMMSAASDNFATKSADYFLTSTMTIQGYSHKMTCLTR